jgi:hypothetical protein
VPCTPLNLACYDPNAMNEVWNNTIIALTEYKQTRIGGYGTSGQWASAIYFVGMKNGPAEAGKYSAYVHDNKFISNHLFVSSGEPVNMTIRIEKNTFTLAQDPPPAPSASHRPDGVSAAADGGAPVAAFQLVLDGRRLHEVRAGEAFDLETAGIPDTTRPDTVRDIPSIPK